MEEGQPLYRDPASQLNSLSKIIFVLYERASLPRRGISPRRAGNFPYTRQSLSWPAFCFWITFHFASSVCLFMCKL